MGYANRIYARDYAGKPTDLAAESFPAILQGIDFVGSVRASFYSANPQKTAKFKSLGSFCSAIELHPREQRPGAV
jgi:hypothetical protein